MAQATRACERCDSTFEVPRGNPRKRFCSMACANSRGRKLCTAAGCEAHRKAKGLCPKHYERWRATGATGHWHDLTPVERFWARVQVAGPDECWIWIGRRDRHGYGLSSVDVTPSGTRPAHRIAYELAVGEIPEGLHIDHLCRVPLCVNPKHLEPVTTAENTARGLHGRLKTHCLRGHALTPENTFVRAKDKARICRACERLRARRDRARRRAAQAA